MAKQKIYLGQADGSATPTLVEGLAVDAIVPGSLVERGASGLSTSNNAATVFNSECLVAQEIGSGRGAEITTAWTIGDTAQAVKVKSGEFVNVRVATGQTIVVGTALSSNGDGTLKLAITDGTEQILFYAEEAVTTSGVTLVTVSKA